MLVGSILANPAALAQRNDGAANPGRIQDRLERQDGRPGVRKPEIAPLEAPETAAPTVPGDEQRRFRLIGAELVGNTIFSAAELGDFYEPYLNREISAKQVDAIVKAITEHYRTAGYFLVRVIAPPQGVEFGILRLHIFEGYIEEVVFKGAPPPARLGLFAEWTARITAERPLRLSTLERNLLLMADIPGLEVTPGLKEKDRESGGYTLELTLKHAAVGGFFNFNNRGTTAVGPMQLYTGVNLNSALGLLERTRLAVFTIPPTPEELLYFEFQQDHLLNADGTQAWLFASRSSVDIGTAGTVSKENSFGTRITLGLSHPWWRMRELDLTTSLKLDAIDSDKNSIESTFDDKIRSVRLGAQLNAADGWGGTNRVAVEFSKGFDVFHASDRDSTLLSTTNGRSDYMKATLDLTRAQKIDDSVQLRLSAAGQWSPHTLLSAEEFAIGGQRFGRAYDPSELAGSQGAAGSVELQFMPPVELPDYLDTVQIYGFYDIGAVWGPGITRDSLASAGAGIRIELFGKFSAELEAAQPLTRPRTPGENDPSEPRFFFSISGRL